MHPIHPDGSTVLCYETHVPIPPSGIVWDPYEEEWVEDGIYSRSDKPTEQYWEPINPGFDYKKERKKEAQKQRLNPEYVDPRLEAYRDECWQRRERGMWFMNYNPFKKESEPVYIPPAYYFYLDHFPLDIGLPKFMMYPDYYYFLLLWYIFNDENCYGIIEVAMRRSGKSYRAMCVMFEYITRGRERHGGIQSKTGDDAERFYKKLFKVMRHMHDFWIPTFNTKNTRSGLQFTHPTGTDFNDADTEVLDSSITWGSADIQYYDSQKLHNYIRDEGGKQQANTSSVYEQWQIVRPALTQGTQKIIGKAIFTSTVEEGGADAFQKLWHDSDPTELNKNGRTPSGLYRYFTPCFEADVDEADKYGYCDQDQIKQFQVNERDSLREDPRKLAAHIRKYPFNIDEAFYRNSDVSPFDLVKLNGYLEQLEWKDHDLTIQGDLIWENGIEDTCLNFVENPKGKYVFNALIDPTSDIWKNATDFSTSRAKPTNKVSIVLGVDPYDHKAIDIGYTSVMSEGAGYAFHKPDGLDDDLSECTLCEYIGRPSDPDVFFEDMLKLAVFFSGEVLVERNKSGMLNYFDKRGYGHWLKKEKGRKERGVNAGEGTKNQAQEVMASHITNLDRVDKIPFPRLIRDLIAFDPANSKKNDAAMAWGWALFAAYRIDRNNRRQIPKKDSEEKKNRNRGLLGRL